LVELVDDAAERESMGRNGRSFVESWISPAGVAQSYADLFADLRT
jgi:hypothetical protein